MRPRFRTPIHRLRAACRNRNEARLSAGVRYPWRSASAPLDRQVPAHRIERRPQTDHHHGQPSLQRAPRTAERPSRPTRRRTGGGPSTRESASWPKASPRPLQRPRRADAVPPSASNAYGKRHCVPRGPRRVQHLPPAQLRIRPGSGNGRFRSAFVKSMSIELATLIRRRVAVTLIFLIAAGCREAPGDAASDAGPSMVRASDLRVLAPTESLAVVEDLAVLPNGTVWVLNSVEPLFLHFSRQGGFPRADGRPDTPLRGAE